LREVESACDVLGFKLVVPATSTASIGLDNVNLDSKQNHACEWAEKVGALAAILDDEKPDLVFAPHSRDFNTTHIGTYALVLDALKVYLEHAQREMLPVIETEFWHQLDCSNLMVGLSAELVAHQMIAIAEHGGEMSRNPYHLRHACRLIDNVRRGSEVVGGQGAAARKFTFAELYRISFVTHGVANIPGSASRVIGPDDPIDIEALLADFRQYL
jgi:LmbE family N-acetylglucosaminyl deacetylase